MTLEGIATMDTETFCDKIREYKKLLYVTAWSVLQNEHEAEDAVSAAVLSAYEHLSSLKKPESFKAWIVTITKNEALKIIRKRMTLPGNDIVEAVMESYTESYDEFSDILASLPEEFRVVVVLFYYDELSIKEISKVLSAPIGTVKSRLSRAKSMLKNILEGGKDNG